LAVILELLRKQQGHDKIAKQQKGKNQRNHRDGAHELPQLLAALDVEKRQGKENYREKQHRHILHRSSHYSRSIGLAGRITETV
jgi:hypothetical protein